MLTTPPPLKPPLKVIGAPFTGLNSTPAGAIRLHLTVQRVWAQGIEAGRYPEAAASSGRSPQAAAVEAVRCATQLLGGGGRMGAPLAMQFLPWLIAAAPQDALAVLQVGVNNIP